MTTPQLPSPHQPLTVSRVQWTGVFEFTRLFEAFRLAINPAKLAIAVGAIALLWLAAFLFDLAWGPQVFRDDMTNREEIDLYQIGSTRDFAEFRAAQAKHRQVWLQEELTRTAPPPAPGTPLDRDWKGLSQSPRLALWTLRSHYRARFHEAIDAAAKDRANEERARANTPAGFWGPESESPAKRELRAREFSARELQRDTDHARDIVGRGVMASFWDYEFRQLDALVDNTLAIVRVSPLRERVSREPPTDLDSASGVAISTGIASRNPDRFWRSDTILGSLANTTLTGPLWLVTSAGPMSWRPENADTWSGWVVMIAFRALYLVSLALLAAFCLVVLAVAGAIITRMAALEFTGHDQVGLAPAVRFARAKLLEFLKAPLLPFALVLVVGIAMALVGLIGAIPFLGEIVIAILLAVILVGGFVLMLLILAIAGGYHLLFPTMAVEGSDSFDAMSRSFAYVYARPWRLVFYTLVSLLYGVLTFLFVSLAAYLVLATTHLFLGWGTDLLGYNHAWYAGTGKLDAIWPTPRAFHLLQPVNWGALSWTEWLAAAVIAFWVYLVAATVAAYALSYYFSSNTILYLLLRRSVDGQSLTDIHEDPAPVEPPAETPAPAATETPAAPPSPPQ